ncbi:MAG: hypothetical protein ACTSQE_02835 [Candidatus Heimdallarchaeaceae archaeon]
MIRAILILTKTGSCKFYRINETSWSSRERKAGLVGFVCALTSITMELGEESPIKILFGENEIIYRTKGDYILAIVKERGYTKLVTRVEKAFEEHFFTLKQNPTLNGITDNEEAKKEERKNISNFARHLNLIVNKKTNKRARKIKEKEKKRETKTNPLVLKDLDLLITNETGQPIYLLLTQSLPYDAVLLVAFISAILDMGQQFGLGGLTEIESRNLVLYIEKIQKAFTIVITQNKDQRNSYQRFARFVANLCNDWLNKMGKSVNEIFNIIEERLNFENMLKLMLETETWEKHIIKQQEIKALEELEISF